MQTKDPDKSDNAILGWSLHCIDALENSIAAMPSWPPNGPRNVRRNKPFAPSAHH